MELLQNVEKIVANSDGQELNSFNLGIQEANTVVIFGAGSYGEGVAKSLKLMGKNVLYFVDNNPKKWGNKLSDITIISPESLLNIKEKDVLIVICSTWHNEIENQLKILGLHNYSNLDFDFQSYYKASGQAILFKQYLDENINAFEKVYHLLSDDDSRMLFEHLLAYRISGNISCLRKSMYPQYFHPKVSPEASDQIIDGGAYIGDTVTIFNEFLKMDCMIHSFEPSKSNFSKLNDFIQEQHLTNVITVQAGLGRENVELFINSIENTVDPSYSISSEGNEKINVISIDEYVRRNELKNISLIKLDIEGYELDALKGAYETIKALRPRLQICLYHKQEDLIDIPIYIHDVFFDLGYKLYVGHHTDSYLETVLYAVAD
ncbi:FkbM family methyltransferase [Lysinibacillus sp. NPDC096212]|uniref:FkbM family methyltransferase n=1 Tax=Lysinibacillus sp. NPDC096212 TaxID=3364135 RepID=UPI0038042A67